MKLEIGKLYKVACDEVFRVNIKNPEQINPYHGEHTMPVLEVENIRTQLWGQMILFLGTENISDSLEMNKFLWNGKFIYNRCFNAVEWEYRFEEVTEEEE